MNMTTTLKDFQTIGKRILIISGILLAVCLVIHTFVFFLSIDPVLVNHYQWTPTAAKWVKAFPIAGLVILVVATKLEEVGDIEMSTLKLLGGIGAVSVIALHVIIFATEFGQLYIHSKP